MNIKVNILSHTYITKGVCEVQTALVDTIFWGEGRGGKTKNYLYPNLQIYGTQVYWLGSEPRSTCLMDLAAQLV